MKVLVVIKASNPRKFLVTLRKEELIREVKSLVARKKHTRAILAALLKGKLEKEIRGCELKDFEADLILSEKTASWDLTK